MMSTQDPKGGDIHFTAQVAGAYVSHDQAMRAAELAHNLNILEKAHANAYGELAKLKDFVNVPGGILGSDKTKHGEIAEHVEVAVRNARDFLALREPTAFIDGVARNAPTDYFVSGDAVQSKFINGARNTLQHVLDHLEKYPEFGTDGHYYHIPKDQHEQIQRVLAGEESELSDKVQRAILARVREVEGATGKSFEDAVRPGVSNYDEVKQGTIHKTIGNYEREFDQSRDTQEAAHRADAGPTLSGAAHATAVGAGVGATIQIVGGIYGKVREGKNPLRGEFTAADWKELGVKGLEGGAKGGISAAAIYALTNCTDMAAPFAGVFVSSAIVLQDIHSRYRKGEISFEEFVDLGTLACAEGAIVGLTTALGQAIIPVPILGAVLGAAAGKLLCAVTKKYIAEDSARLEKELTSRFQTQISRLDAAYQSHVSRLLMEHDRLGALTNAAFDLELNTDLRLQASIDLITGGAQKTADGLAPKSGLRISADRSTQVWVSSSHYFFWGCSSGLLRSYLCSPLVVRLARIASQAAT